MHSGDEMILRNRHHQPRYKMTFVIRLVAVHPMELRIESGHHSFNRMPNSWVRPGNELCPRDMVPNSDFGMMNGEP